MVCLGSKTLRRKVPQQTNLSDSGFDEEDLFRKRGKKDNGKKPRKGNSSLSEADGSVHKEKKSKDRFKGNRHGSSENPSKITSGKETVTNVLRKGVDPETAKYFLEIANLFESNTVDLEERATLCSNALEETRGKELELATDGVISRTLQTLVESCEVEQLCGLLNNCVKSFAVIAVDKSGSHVAEAALKSLVKHLQDDCSNAEIEVMLDKICKVIAADSVNVMCSPYGSHVLRTLLCVCRGVPLDYLQDFHATKTSAALAERFSPGSDRSVRHDREIFNNGFTDMFKFLVREMLNNAKDEVSALRFSKHCSFVLQTALKLSIGDDEELAHIISILIGSGIKQEIMNLLEDTVSSHLLEVIVEVAPEDMYNEILTDTFRGALFEISSHHYGNFVVQALVSKARTTDQMAQIWEEIGPKMKELLELGKSGVVASIVAACQRLQIKRLECSESLAAVVSADLQTPNITAHILFLESFLREKSSWKWPFSEKMSFFGSLMLQNIFRYPHQYVRPYVASLLSMDGDQIVQTAKDPGGSRVLEAFLCSSVAGKRKFKVFAKLQGRYGEIAMIPSSSFLIEKCFNASNISHKEAIVMELVAVRADLSKTKHGLHLLKNLDVDGFARRPEQWKSNLSSKESAGMEFQAEFGADNKTSGQSIEQHEHSDSSTRKKRKRNKKTDVTDQGPDTNEQVPSSVSQDSNLKRQKSNKRTAGKEYDGKKFISETAKKPFLANPGNRKSHGPPPNKQSFKRQKSHMSNADKDSGSKNFIRNSTNPPFFSESVKRKSSMSNLADLASKRTLSAGDVYKLFKPGMKSKD